MGKTKSSKEGKLAKAKQNQGPNGHSKMPSETPEQLYASAVSLVETSRPEDALRQAQKLWKAVQNQTVTAQLPALNLLGEISVELGAGAEAQKYFEAAVKLDPDGRIPEAQGGGAEKFLWLAQLCEEGGAVSVRWFEQGVQALKMEIAALESGAIRGLDEEESLMLRVEKKRKLANALCGIVEVYMTDLSWEEDAEARCESLVTEAMTVEDETSPEVLQTLASVRLSQTRLEDAQSAMKRSLETWNDLDPEDPAVPDFPTRISLARLLMEAEMEDDAMDVLDRLVSEDDQSVETWYLGGWCLHLQAEKTKNTLQSNGAQNGEYAMQVRAVMKSSREWLSMSLKLYDLQDYEDDRLHDHAKELVEDLNANLGPVLEGEDAEEGVEEWNGIDDDDDNGDADEDEEMEGT